MAEIPEAALAAAVRALQAHPWPDGETTETQAAKIVLEAAAPLLAEAWGVKPDDDEPVTPTFGHLSTGDLALIACITGGGIRNRDLRVEFDDDDA